MSLFVIDLHYTADLREIDALAEEHRSYLRDQYEASLLLASGPKLPRTGGVILARAADRVEVDLAINEDPFKSAGVAEYTVTEFKPVMHPRNFPI
ncbi:GTP cyclohydrolase [Labrenzia sp. CP4]|uniref:YciI family protein n=1 Tax=Labrenzia sp. CP4 TaxID=1674922 RepID=UPI000782BC16|nr:YciI family protein [Labrenzia sp. CP4]AMN55877.1 GTP cyclohydrolase [Labrenzia sp. CP4]